ncbi:hypothetical protein UFOVP836_46 [uncultured Caudovirales phage]|uniref:Uncharacterized protein n=1 Tax=uncultured Caudovirales phage TaxID=2100421 RepID=A0A6J5PB26_9CAUD|nr:hypothetical protein UFOVP836_46 [uncultured Caudovirales phage]
MAQAYSAAGSLLQFGSSSPVTYATIPYVQGYQYGGSERPRIDVTPISASAYEFIADIPGEQNISFDLAYDPDDTQHAALLSAYNNQTLLYFRDRHDNTGACDEYFTGYVTQWNRSAQKGAARMIAVVITMTGAVNTVP